MKFLSVATFFVLSFHHDLLGAGGGALGSVATAPPGAGPGPGAAAGASAVPPAGVAMMIGGGGKGGGGLVTGVGRGVRFDREMSSDPDIWCFLFYRKVVLDILLFVVAGYVEEDDRAICVCGEILLTNR